MLKAISTHELHLSRQKAIQIFALTIICIVSITVFQDYLQSRRNHYSFYLSESILFKTFWVLFLPVTLFQVFIFKKFNHLIQNKPAYLQWLTFVLIAFLLHSWLFAVSVFLLSAVFFDHSYPIMHTLDYTIAEDTYKYLLIYGIIGFLYFRNENFQSEKGPAEPQVFSGRFIDKIIVGTARNHRAIATKDIILISSSSPYIAIHTANGKHLHLETLKSIQAKLDDSQFVRIHKSTIIHLKKVVSYKSRLNGDYDILLDDGQEVRLSRNYVRTFKQRFGK